MPSKSNNWLWFFGVLGVLGFAAMAINWIYNVRQQLKPEELAAAEKLWSEQGPADYNLTIEKSVRSAGANEPNKDTIEARIRARQVISATINGTPMEKRLLPDYDMPAWFSFVRDFQEIDSKPGAPRTFRAATFSPNNGALLQFRRRVSGTREQQEVIIKVSSPS